MLQDFRCISGMRQLICKDTRRQIVNGVIQTSLIDHLYSTQPDLIMTTRVAAITESDHLCIWAKKATKIPKYFPKQVIKRSFKNLDVRGYLEDLQRLDIVQKIRNTNAEDAAETLDEMLSQLLDQYAPKKLIQNRKNHCPALSQETKMEIKVRNRLRSQVYSQKKP